MDKQFSLNSARLQDTRDEATQLIKRIEKFVAAANDEFIDVEAWSIFHVWVDGHPSKEVQYYPVFQCWQFFHWKPQPETVNLPIKDECRTIATAFVNREAPSLTDAEVNLIRRASEHPLDIYELGVFDGDFVTAHGCTHRKNVMLFAPGLSKKAKSGEFIMAHAIPSEDGPYIILGHSQVLPRQARAAIQNFMKLAAHCGNGPGAFEALQSDLFNLFYDLSKDSKKTIA